MHTSFYVGIPKGAILFQGLKLTTVGELTTCCCIIAIVGFLNEGLKYYRNYLSARDLTIDNRRYDEQDEMIDHRCNLSHIKLTGLHLVNVTMGYMLMMIVMTFNVWLCLSVLVGSFVGYFVFGGHL
ncbi:High affinity copper uptake protein 1 [Halotydeus destructor]|nr:High affinity copper uptake protein 1 [Halotydeus destructor]